MTWMIVDGNNWFARDWYATQHARAGNIAEQFMKRLAIIRNQYELDRVVVAWDSPGSFRRGISQDYKAHRSGKPPEYDAALASAMSAIGDHFDSIKCPTFEADDIIASVVQVAREIGEHVVIFSSDADLHQLLCKDGVSQALAFHRQSRDTYSLKCMTAALLERDYGVRPTQWVDYRAITGDSSDGIKGMTGVGPKAAREVLQKCASLEVFYRSPFAVNISDSKRNIIIQHRPQLPQLRELLTLRNDVPLPEHWLRSLHEIGATCGN